jgi:hypothetical protein
LAGAGIVFLNPVPTGGLPVGCSILPMLQKIATAPELCLLYPRYQILSFFFTPVHCSKEPLCHVGSFARLKVSVV